MAWFSWTTTDIIGDLAFGDNFQCLEKQVENFWMASILKVMRPALWIGILQRWGLGAFALVLLPRKIIHGLLENDHFVESSKGGEEDMGFTFEELKSITSDILTAGSESMATVLTGIVFNLIRNPMVYAKVTGEIRCKFARDEDICFKTTSPPALPYLTGVIKESIRHYTAAPLFSGRVVPNYADGGDTFDGYRLPAGTRVTAAPVVAFQSSYNFSRPDSFVPERWFPVGNGRPEEFDNDNHDAFLPFSYGPRNCIVEEAEEWERWIEKQPLYFLYVKGPLMVSITKRKAIEGF
ncbi:putative benzoate 4-monooxygenase cytochrome p450 [Diaporthe ampelina]|uniref:Putative benzoate 4-monooxygenase cytochrome p450 n=1 Tax=Diaporthe ampelina TaxID=1214573 RepID=A0A0G2HLW9_9PEZI|nr:putative benzoate 4-monooxygenase cytochrome p450 [Diaporthe ampelina]